jgi:hypothetical protein
VITREEFISRYFGRLMEQAFANDTEREMYAGTCLLLFDIPFYWTHSNLKDENRAADAAIYRKYERYMLDQEKHRIAPEWLNAWENATPSVFEVMIAIAERWSEFFEKPIAYYFSRHLFRNLGFHQFRGALRRTEEEAVRWTVDRWMSRQIEHNGEGSPFPLQHHNVDMRTADIWNQMNAYSHQYFQ